MYQLIVMLIPLLTGDPVELRHQQEFATSVLCEAMFTEARASLAASLQAQFQVEEGVHYRMEHSCKFDSESLQRGS